MAPDATEGKELRPPSLDRRRNAAGSQEHAAASRVMSSASPTHRTAAPRVAALHVRSRGRVVSRSEPAGSGLHAPRGRYRAVRLDDPASQDVVRHACTRFRGEKRQDDHPHNAPRLCAWSGFERGRLRPHIQWIRRRGAGSTYRIEPAGLSAAIILATLDAPPASCGLRLGGECPNRHGGAWRTSPPHCTSLPSGPWPDRK